MIFPRQPHVYPPSPTLDPRHGSRGRTTRRKRTPKKSPPWVVYICQTWCGRKVFIDNLLVRIHFIIEVMVVDRPCATGFGIIFPRQPYICPPSPTLDPRHGSRRRTTRPRRTPKKSPPWPASIVRPHPSHCSEISEDSAHVGAIGFNGSRGSCFPTPTHSTGNSSVFLHYSPA